MRRVSLASVFVLMFFCTLSVAKEHRSPLRILFTNDIHSNFKSSLGGYLPLSGVISQQRATSNGIFTIVVDAGDMAMGSMYQTLYRDYAPEMSFFSIMGYSALTMGNHDFDFGTAAYSNMLGSAIKSGTESARKRVPLLVANIEFSGDSILNRALIDYGRRDFLVIDSCGLKVAIIGIMGEGAYHDAPDLSRSKFIDPVRAISPLVDSLRPIVDYIVVLSHGGTVSHKGREAADISLAQNVQGIDIIISGHDHDLILDPIKVGDTYIVSSGWGAEYLGRATLSGDELVDYRLIPVGNSTPDSLFYSKYDYLDSLLLGRIFTMTGLRISDTIFENSQKLLVNRDNFDEANLARVIAKSYSDVLLKRDMRGGVIAIVPFGTVRGELDSGAVTYKDVFNVLSLGEGENMSPGYPLVSCYLYGSELRDVCELNLSVAPSLPDARLFFHGLKYSYASYRPPFSKIVSMRVDRGDGTYVPVHKDSLYCVVAGMYTAKMLALLKRESFSILSAEPRDEQGNKIGDLSFIIVRDLDGKEVKEWEALALLLKGNTRLEGEYVWDEKNEEKISSFNIKYLFVMPSITLYLLWLVVILFIGGVIFFIKRVVLR